MRKYLPLLLCLAVLGAAYCAEQTAAAPAPQEDGQPGDPEVKEEYDEAEDRTNINLTLAVPTDRDPSLRLFVHDSSKGRSYTPSERVGFAVMSKEGTLVSEAARTLRLTLNGSERLKLEAGPLPGGTRLAFVPAKTFLKIARAERVEGEIGKLKFVLSQEQRAALREFAARMGRPPARSEGKPAGSNE